MTEKGELLQGKVRFEKFITAEGCGKAISDERRKELEKEIQQSKGTVLLLVHPYFQENENSDDLSEDPTSEPGRTIQNYRDMRRELINKANIPIFAMVEVNPKNAFDFYNNYPGRLTNAIFEYRRNNYRIEGLSDQSRVMLENFLKAANLDEKLAVETYEELLVTDLNDNSINRKVLYVPTYKYDSTPKIGLNSIYNDFMGGRTEEFEWTQTLLAFKELGINNFILSGQRFLLIDKESVDFNLKLIRKAINRSEKRFNNNVAGCVGKAIARLSDAGFNTYVSDVTSR